jgi:hypothetical protein
MGAENQCYTSKQEQNLMHFDSLLMLPIGIYVFDIILYHPKAAYHLVFLFWEKTNYILRLSDKKYQL